MKEEKKQKDLQSLEDAKKSFMEEDLNDLEFEIEELETRLAFMQPTDGGGCGACACECGFPH